MKLLCVALHAALKSLFGADTLSVFEETEGYQPPEVFVANKSQNESLNATDFSSPTALRRDLSFDVWGVGLAFLELALGTRRPLSDPAPSSVRRSF